MWRRETDEHVTVFYLSFYLSILCSALCILSVVHVSSVSAHVSMCVCQTVQPDLMMIG